MNNQVQASWLLNQNWINIQAKSDLKHLELVMTLKSRFQQKKKIFISKYDIFLTNFRVFVREMIRE